jgi:mono/diheme cytochrome c family protein
MRNLATCVLVWLLAGCTYQIDIPALVTAAAGQETTAGNPERGQQIFSEGMNGAPPCFACHQTVENNGFSVGPSLAGIADRAAAQIPGTTAHDYLRASILEPGAYVVAGYRNIMYPDYAAHLSPQAVEDLIAFLLTLES